MHQSYRRGQSRKWRPAAGSTGDQLIPNRKPLRDMQVEEFIEWAATRSAALADFSEYVQKWMRRRTNQGKHNYHDEQYQGFQELAADLIAALDEWREGAEQAAAQAKWMKEE